MNQKLPVWANCWVKNTLTGEIMPAFDNDQTWELYDAQGDVLGREWCVEITKAEIIGFTVFMGLAFIGVLFAAFLYFSAIGAW